MFKYRSHVLCFFFKNSAPIKLVCNGNQPPRWSTMIPNSWYLYVVISPPILKQAYSLWLVEYGGNDGESFQMKLIKYTVASTWHSLCVSCSGRSHLQWHGHTQDDWEAHMARNWDLLPSTMCVRHLGSPSQESDWLQSWPTSWLPLQTWARTTQLRHSNSWPKETAG